MSGPTVKVSVLIPTFNEAATIRDVVSAVRSVRMDGVSFEIVVVDDGSTDGTDTLCRESLANEIDVFERQPENRGKGAAIRRGFLPRRGRLC